MGYLAVTLTLHKDHSLLLLLVNSLQTDLRSDNFLEVSFALSVVAKLVNNDIVPAVMKLVLDLLDHKQALVRKKAVICMHRFLQLNPRALDEHKDRVRKVLCDIDPSVMGATVLLIQDLAAADPASYKDLIPSFVSILKQVTEHRLPRDFDYHRIPAPWIQMDLLRLLATLGHADRRASESMYEVLGDVMKRAAIGTNIGYAIVYECVRTVTAIYPNPTLLEAAAQAISHFLTSENHNLKYLGVTSLAAIVTIDPQYAVEHQLVVVDCLDDPDETLRRKTLDLLYSMTNRENVLAIVDRLLKFLATASDPYLRTDLITRLSHLAEKYAPDTEWYINTMTKVFELGGDLVRPELANNLMRLLATGGQTSKEDGLDELGLTQDTSLIDGTRQRAVDSYIALLQSGKVLPDIMIKTLVWVIGEYGHLSSTARPSETMSLLAATMNRVFVDPTVRSWILAALQAVIAHSDEAVPAEVMACITRFQSSISVDTEQRSQELAELLKNRRLMAAVLPPNAHAAPVKVDEKLGFLEKFVQAALAAGAKPYQSPDQLAASNAEHEKHRQEQKQNLRFEAYEKPAAPVVSAPALAPTASYFTETGLRLAPSDDHLGGAAAAAAGAGAAPGATLAAGGLKLRAAPKLWGPKGFNAPTAPPPPPPPPAAPAAPAAPSASAQALASANRAVASSASPSPATSPATSPSSTTAPASAPAPAKPRVLTEKERSAQSLFAGIGHTAVTARPAFVTPAAHRPPASASSSASSYVPATMTTAPTSAAAVAPVASASSTPIPLNLFMDSTPAPTSSPASSNTLPHTSPSTSTAGGFDILASLGASSASAPAPAAPAPASGDFDILGALSSTPSTTSSSSSGGFGGLSMGMGMGGLPTTSPTSSTSSAGDMLGIVNQAPALGASASIPSLASILSGYQLSPEVPLASANGLQVSTVIATQAAATLVVVYVSNPSFSTTLPAVTLNLSFPQNSVTAQATFHHQANHNAENARSNGQGLFVGVVDSMPALTTAALVVKVSAVDARVFSKGFASANATASYVQGRDTKASGGVVHIPTSALIRPYVIATKQYGDQWKAVGAAIEHKSASQRTSAKSPADVERSLSTVSIHPVQTIKTETIAAATLLGNVNQPVYCHVRLGEYVCSHFSTYVLLYCFDLFNVIICIIPLTRSFFSNPCPCFSFFFLSAVP